MKAILEFNLDDLEDETAYARCIKAKSMAIVLWDLDQHLRNKCKYGDESGELDDITYKALNDVRDTLREMMNDNGIDLDELLK